MAAPGSPEPGAAPRIAAVVLAAGRSTRAGDVNKLTALIDGVPMVARAVALQTGWRAALATDERRALLLAERVRRDLPAVQDDRGVRGEGAPFGVSASAVICEALRTPTSSP